MARPALARTVFAGVVLAVAIAGLIVTLGTLLRRATPETLITIAPLPTEQVRPVTIYVGGAVARPGLYTLPPGERVEGAIVAAGGLTADADPDGLNRALRLQDEAQIVVPRRGEPTATAAPRQAVAGLAPAATVAVGAARGTPVPSPSGPIDINRADAVALARLPGVGPKLAQEIIDYRAAHGPFAVAADLANVKGISERMVGEWQGLIVVVP